MLTRRKFVSGALAFPFISKGLAAGADPRFAKSVIEIWLWGGPSQLETFDPKPLAPHDYSNDLKSIPTKIKGMELHEWLPRLANCADLFSVVRSLTHPHFGHETATYLMQTGRMPGGGDVCPAIGAVVAMEKSKTYRGDLPPFVILTQAKGRFSEVGFLGEKYAPLVTGGNPNAARFIVDGIVPPGGMAISEVEKRFELASRLDTFGRAAPDAAFTQAGEMARKVIYGSAAKTFDLSQESDATRTRYGRTQLGQSCLAARRLVEYGVPYITINVPGWDSHKRHFETIKQRTAELDTALSALLEDLRAKGLLETTIVWASGEFGRKPHVDWEAPWNGGRNHWASCFSALIAGGGFAGGRVVGASDELGEHPAARPVSPTDFLGSIYERCGINPDGPLENSAGKTMTVLPPASAQGRLHELYT